MPDMIASADRWAADAGAEITTGVRVSAAMPPDANHGHCADENGDVWVLVRIPAAEASVLKPLVAARAAADSDPYASHLADAGMTAALRAWGAS